MTDSETDSTETRYTTEPLQACEVELLPALCVPQDVTFAIVGTDSHGFDLVVYSGPMAGLVAVLTEAYSDDPEWLADTIGRFVPVAPDVAALPTAPPSFTFTSSARLYWTTDADGVVTGLSVLIGLDDPTADNLDPQAGDVEGVRNLADRMSWAFPAAWSDLPAGLEFQS